MTAIVLKTLPTLPLAPLPELCFLCRTVDSGGVWCEITGQAANGEAVPLKACQACAEALFQLVEADRCARCGFSEKETGPLTFIHDPDGIWPVGDKGLTGSFCEHCFRVLMKIEFL